MNNDCLSKNTEKTKGKKENWMTEKGSWCVIFRNHNTHVRLKKWNSFLSSAPMSQTVKPIKFGECPHKTKISTAEKPTKERRQERCHICPMGQDHKPPIHQKLVENSMGLVNGQPLCRTSICTHWTKHCKYSSEIHTFHLSHASFKQLSIFWKDNKDKNKNKLKVRHRLFSFDPLRLNWFYQRVNFKKKKIHVLNNFNCRQIIIET